MTTTGPHPLDGAVAAIRQARPFVADAWEAAAVAESLGYSDARVRREFGCADTRAFGELIFERLMEDEALPAASAPRLQRTGPAAALRDAAPSLLPAILWLTVLAIGQTASPAVAAPVASGVMLSLVVCGGFVAAMRRRGTFHRLQQQPAVAAATAAYFGKVAAIATVAAVALGLGAGWLRGDPWPRLVIWADAFVLGSAVLIAGGAIIGRGGWSRTRLTAPIPHMSVVLVQALPVVVCVAAVFGFLLAGRVMTDVSPADRLVMDVAVLVALLALGGVDHAAQRFSRRLADAAHVPITGARESLPRLLANAHLRGLSLTIAAFVVAAAVVAAALAALLPSAAMVSTGLLAGLAAYLLLVCSAFNARVLIELQRRWRAAAALVAGVVASVAAGAALGGLVAPDYAAAGPLAGGVLACAYSTAAVRAAIRRAELAVASL